MSTHRSSGSRFGFDPGGGSAAAAAGNADMADEMAIGFDSFGPEDNADFASMGISFDHHDGDGLPGPDNVAAVEAQLLTSLSLGDGPGGETVADVDAVTPQAIKESDSAVDADWELDPEGMKEFR